MIITTVRDGVSKQQRWFICTSFSPGFKGTAAVGSTSV